jgi:hypothetical protein
VVHLAWRAALRDLRAGELRLLLVAVGLAVAALTAVGFFADRLNAGLARDARQLLGGDAVVASDRATPPALPALARQLGLRTAETVSFPSMGRAPDARGGETRLVAVKAVSSRCATAPRTRRARWPRRLRRARCGWTRRCWTRSGCSWATSCCWATRPCGSPG